jgi:hypothetical protein
VVQSWALGALQGFVSRRVARQVGMDHPVLSRFGAFYEHAIRMFELRIERLGLSDRPLREISWTGKLALVAGLPLRQLGAKLRRSPPLLTRTYLGDPALEAEARRFSVSGDSA